MPEQPVPRANAPLRQCPPRSEIEDRGWGRRRP